MSRILIVDDELQMRELMCRFLEPRGHKVLTVPDAEQALAALTQEVYDLVLLDYHLGRDSAVSIVREIRKAHSKVPVIVYSGGFSSGMEGELKAEGANEVLNKNIGASGLVEHIEKMIKQEKSPAPAASYHKGKSILVVDDEEPVRKLLGRFFASKGFRTFEAGSGPKALELMRSEKPSLALIDIHMPGMGGLDVLKEMGDLNPRPGVIMVSGQGDDANVKSAMELGASGYVLKPFDFLYLELVVMSKLTAGA